MIVIGCDVSKGFADITVLNNLKETVFPCMKIDDSHKGEDRYLKLLEKIKKEYPDDLVVVAMETTGGFERNLAGFFHRVKEEFNIELFVLNPKPIKNFKEMDLHVATTDESASKIIALYALTNYGKLKSCFVSDNKVRALRKNAKVIKGIVKQIVRKKNQLQSILYTVFPEILPSMKDGTPLYLLNVLEKYPVPLKLKKAKVSILKKINGVTEEKARKLIALAKSSRGMDNCKEFVPAVKEAVQLLLIFMKRENAMKKVIADSFSEDFSDNPILTIKGIGEYSAAIIMAFTEDVKRFNTKNKYVAYFGLDPVTDQSGDKNKRRRISKKGVSLVRAILFMDCLSMLKIKNHPISRYYYKLKGQGKKHYYAMTACMRKLLLIVYAILNSGKKFDMNYEDYNKAKKQSDKDILRNKMGINNLKVASLDLDVPVSRKEVKKRKLIKELKNMEKFPNKIQTRSLKG